MGTRLEWADISPYRAVLYQIDDENPFNRKVGSVEYNHDDKKFIAIVNHERSAAIVDAQINLDSKIEAMETTMAMMVVRRFDQANKSNNR